MGSTVSCVEDIEDICNARPVGGKQRVEMAAQVSTSTFTFGDEESYGVGLLWLVRNDKLIVAGFGNGSDGPRAGVRTGDILAQVDGNMVLDLKSVHGKHPAGDMMAGSKDTVCELKFLRVQETEEVLQRRASLTSPTRTLSASSTQSGGDDNDIKLKEVTCSVKRLVPMGSVGINAPHMTSS